MQTLGGLKIIPTCYTHECTPAACRYPVAGLERPGSDKSPVAGGGSSREDGGRPCCPHGKEPSALVGDWPLGKSAPPGPPRRASSDYTQQLLTGHEEKGGEETEKFVSM